MAAKSKPKPATPLVRYTNDRTTPPPIVRYTNDRTTPAPPVPMWNYGAGIVPQTRFTPQGTVPTPKPIVPAPKPIVPTNWWEVGAGATPQYVPPYVGPLVGLTNDETRRAAPAVPLVRYTNDRTTPTKERSMDFPMPAVPEQAYAPEYFGPVSSGGQMSALSPGYSFPVWEGGGDGQGGYERGGYGGYGGRGGYGQSDYEPGAGFAYEEKPQLPRRYDYGLTNWRF